MAKQATITVFVSIDEREGGGIRVSSSHPMLRGLHLAGNNRDHVWSMIAPAITTLLMRNHNIKVAQVRAEQSIEDLASLPQDVDMHVDHEEKLFVVELQAA